MVIYKKNRKTLLIETAMIYFERFESYKRFSLLHTHQYIIICYQLITLLTKSTENKLKSEETPQKMFKMNILSTTRRLLQFSGFIPFERVSLISNFAQNVLIVIICALSMLSMATFFVNATNYSKLNDLLNSFYVAALAYSVMCVHMNLMEQKTNIIKFIDDLEVIVRTRAQISAKVIEVYASADKFNEKLSKCSIAFTGMSAIGVVLHWTSTSVWIFLSENHSVDELTMFYPLA